MDGLMDEQMECGFHQLFVVVHLETGYQKGIDEDEPEQGMGWTFGNWQPQCVGWMLWKFASYLTQLNTNH